MSHQKTMQTKQWLSSREIAQSGLPGLPKTKQGVRYIAKRDSWATLTYADGRPCVRPRKGRGGGIEYHVSVLPPDAGRLQRAMAMPAPEPRQPPFCLHSEITSREWLLAIDVVEMRLEALLNEVRQIRTRIGSDVDSRRARR